MSYDLGSGFDGIGMGDGIYWKYLALWVSFFLLSTTIVNILIAIISDGFEIHKDMQRLRTRSGQTFIKYASNRLIYFTIFSLQLNI